MDKTSLQMLFGVLLGVFLLALIVMTVVYVRRKLADKREEALRDLDLMQEEAIREEQSQSKGYWINRDDIEDENQAHLLRYYHYFDNIATAAYGNNEVHLHPYYTRRLSVSEALAIQSLPKEYVINKELSKSSMFKMVGNGVPYLLAKGIAKAIRKFLNEEVR